MEFGHLFGAGHKPFNRYPQRRQVKPSTPQERRRANARRTLEDMQLARELNIHYNDLKVNP